MDITKAQQEERIRWILEASRDPKLPGMINQTGMEYVSFDPDAKRLCLSFPCLEWEVSPRGNIQGGMLAMLFDMSMGALCALYAGVTYLTTLELTTRFIHPVRLGETLLIDAEILSQGKTILNLRATARAKSDNRLLASAESSFMLVHSLKSDYMG